MAAHTMVSEIETEDLILEAIAEFRELMNRLIDEQKALMTNRGMDIDSKEVRELIPAFSHATGSTKSAILDLEAMEGTEPTNRRLPVASGKPKVHSSSAPNLADVGTGTLAPVSDEANLAADQRDPRQRLDALARLLDKRLKHSGAVPQTSPPKRETSEVR